LLQFVIQEDILMKILLAIDSSEFSRAVVKEVAERPWPADSVLVVLTVVDSFALTASVGYLEPFIKNENDAARALVQSVAETLTLNGIETVTQVVEGYPATSIVEQAKVWNADFVFVGSHGHGGVARFFLGSIAKEVVRGTHCSVEIVRPVVVSKGRAAGKRVLLATDGSAYSEAAARSVAQRPWPKGTEFKIVSVVEQMVPAMDPGYASGEVIERMLIQNRTQCEAAVGSAMKILASTGLAAGTSVLSGNAKWTIIDAAKEWNADLLVVGSHGRRGLTRVLLGSVSEAVAMNAPCSVEVIRSPELLEKE
jgi:nucleotide-binding universal stress UspA family protein